MAESVPLILLMAALLVLSGLASGSETALFSLTHGERAQLRRSSPLSGAAVEALLGRPRRLLVYVLLLNMSVNVTYFVVSAVLTTRAGSGAVGVAVGLGSILAIVLFGEVLAKLLAGANRVWYCRLMAPPLAAGASAARPLIALLDTGVIAPLTRLIRPHSLQTEESSAVRDLGRLIDAAVAAGHVDEEEHLLLEEIVELRLLRARQVMTPRGDLPTVDVDAPPERVIATLAGSPSGVALVCRGSVDAGVEGLLSVKAYLSALESRGSVRVLEHCRTPLFIPETARLDALLERFRDAGRREALCVDERGVLSGMVTLDDVADELLRGLGADKPSGLGEVTLVGVGSWEAPGRLGLADWAELFADEAWRDRLHARRVSTIGGLIIEELGRLARVGDEVAIGGLTLRVVSLQGRAVDRVLIRLDGVATPLADPRPEDHA